MGSSLFGLVIESAKVVKPFSEIDLVYTERRSDFAVFDLLKAAERTVGSLALTDNSRTKV